MRFLNFFKKQNLLIKVGFVSLAIMIIALVLSIILISTANFVAKDPNQVTNPAYIGNGWNVINTFGIDAFFSKSSYGAMHDQYKILNEFTSAPLAQLLSGVIFLIIVLPTFGGIALLALLSGYFKKWLYS